MRDDLNQTIKAAEKDVVCGMTVDPDRAAAQSAHNGRTFHFCSKGCAAKFAAAPEKYLDAPAALAHGNDFVVPSAETSSSNTALPGQVPGLKPRTAAEYICPMDPEVSQDHPGACPKCGMALEPAVPIQPESRVEY